MATPTSGTIPLNMSLGAGNTGGTGWYLLSGSTPSTAGHPNVGTGDNGLTNFTNVHSSRLTSFADLICDNLYGPTVQNQLFTGGSLTFGSTIYYFDHRKWSGKTNSVGNNDPDGWQPSENFMQDNWNTINIGTSTKWTDLTYSIDGDGKVSIDGGRNADNYASIDLDMRFGYWIYIVSNTA